MSETVFYKNDGSVSSVRKNLTKNIQVTIYPDDNRRGGFTFKGTYVGVRLGKGHRLVSYGFGDGKNITYFDRSHKKLNYIGQF